MRKSSPVARLRLLLNNPQCLKPLAGPFGQGRDGENICRGESNLNSSFNITDIRKRHMLHSSSLKGCFAKPKKTGISSTISTSWLKKINTWRVVISIGENRMRPLSPPINLDQKNILNAE